uniref:Mitochondrial coiled-coil domain 1 n=1 Tax=Equus caballus TaxID=9796 RepID=A0A9L0S3N5_HORSE
VGLPLSWLSQCCCPLLLPSWPRAPLGYERCCYQSPKSTKQTSATGSGKMRSHPRSPQPDPTAKLAQAEELLEQQLELSQALLEGQQGVWEAHALVLKTQKRKEQRRRHRESLRGDA